MHIRYTSTVSHDRIVCSLEQSEVCTPFAVHLRRIYIHLRQPLKLYGKYMFIRGGPLEITEGE